jgi:Ca2+-binding EF-hand superfamily protein
MYLTYPLQYDKDNSGSINSRELRTCLYSLGEERSKTEIKNYMAEFGRGGELPFEPFRELMVRLLGDAGNEAAILESFQVISAGHESVSSATLSDLLSADDVRFIASTAPKTDSGFDYIRWVAEVCAR